MARPIEDVYCTLVMSDSYLPGAAVLAHSLRDAGTSKKLAALITLDTLSADTIGELKSLYDYLIPVERIRNPQPANLFLMGRPDLAFAFTKIALWRQTQFRKIVYLDADIVALRAMDELFDIEASFAAAPDIGWPDAFNTGVMVIKPDMGEYWALQTMSATGDSFDGADQGLLNQYFEHRPWHRLNFTYNCTPNAQYQWEPAYRYYKRDIAAVHFIGKDKPWSGSRSGGGGVYNELLARWWAVHDRHLKKPTAQTPGIAPQPNSGADHGASASVHQHGQSEGSTANTGTPSSAPPPTIVVEPEAPLITTETPFTEPGEQAENIDQGLVTPVPTAEQRRFSAPQMEWDATRSEPPIESKPEAANFPNETYAFSDSHELFKAPRAYPEPPKDMWYKVPESKPTPAAPPKPIFPWEQHSDRPKASRIFAEDLPPEPTPAAAPVSPSQPSPTHPFSTVHYEDDKPPRAEAGSAGSPSPERVASPKSADEQWQEFQQNSANAWDSVPGIDTYVRAIMDAQTRRGKPQVLSPTTNTIDIGSPPISRDNRRESLIITDFPTAVERPSLPVTPAPIRRPTFWGEERDEVGELPAAEGVPDQAEWVCPQCGFSSVSASDFSRRRGSSTSTTTAVATPLPPPVSKTLSKPSLSISTSASKPLVSKPHKADPPKTDFTQPEPHKADLRNSDPPVHTPPKKEPTKSIVSTIPHARSGLSASGVPLASLTDPNPQERLEQLRRSSLIEFEHLKQPDHPEPPLRELPEHSVSESDESSHAPVAVSGDGLQDAPATTNKDGAADKNDNEDEKTAKTEKTEKSEKSNEPAKIDTSKADKPLFRNPDFRSGSTSEEPLDDLLSPMSTESKS